MLGRATVSDLFLAWRVLVGTEIESLDAILPSHFLHVEIFGEATQLFLQWRCMAQICSTSWLQDSVQASHTGRECCMFAPQMRAMLGALETLHFLRVAA